MFNRLPNSRIQEMVGMYSRRSFTGLAPARDSSAMVTPTRLMSRSLSMAPRCGSRKLAPSTVLCAKLME